MYLTKKQMLEVIENSSEGFQRSLENASVLENLAEFGITAERLTKALELNQKADEYFRSQGSKRGSKISVHIQESKKLDESVKKYRNLRRILKKAFKNQPEIIQELQLNVTFPTTNLGKTKRLKEFYEVCMKKDTLQAKVIDYGLTPEKLEMELNEIREIEKGFLEKSLARMLSEKATQDRDKVLQELVDEWYIVREVLIACYGESDPQFLECFGISIPTGGLFKRRKKKKNADNENSENNESDEDTGNNGNDVSGEIAGETADIKIPIGIQEDVQKEQTC